MTPVSPLHSSLRPRLAGSRLLCLIAGIVLTRGLMAAEAPPIGTFSLPDLNAASPRLGQSISPRDYGQWISAYYFGNEG